jgi:serine/threonine protein phosphatase PrpC
MGGLARGTWASRTVVAELQEHFGDSLRLSADDAAGRIARLRAAARCANLRVWSLDGTASDSTRGSAGATVVALSLCPHRGTATWLHLGDSRLYRVRGGLLELLTADHTLAGFPYREKPAIPLDLPHTNKIMHALGLEPEAEPDIAMAPLLAGDVFLLCTDGVSAVVSAEEMRQELSRHNHVAARAAALLQRALAAPTQDNASLIVVEVRDA